MNTDSLPEQLRIESPDLGIGALAWGPADGPLALCLHGYPDTAWTYRHLGPTLAERGWRVVAPYSRGYAPTDLPADGAYQIGALVRDAVEVRRALGIRDRAVLIGHDWGAIAAAGAAVATPDLFDRLVLLAVPPIPALLADKKLLLRQAPSSWYTLVNQIPWLPEAVLGRFVPLLWSRWSPGYDAAEDLRYLWQSLNSRARRTAAVRYYRANAQPWRRQSAYRPEQRAAMKVPKVPTMYLHGAEDGCVRSAVVEQARPLVEEAHVIPGSGHFLHLERPEAVNQLISSFIGDPR